MTLSENRRLQTEANRRQAYTQLMGEKAELLFQQLAEAHDKFTFYQGHTVQLAGAANARSHLTPEMKALNDPLSYQAEALLQERNSDHYSDEAVACGEKDF